jgi:hypothetical protein
MRFLIHDCDSLFTAAFGEMFKAEGLEVIITLPKTPRMNAVCERVIGTLRCELLDRTLVLGECHLAAVSPRVREALQRPQAAPVPAAATPLTAKRSLPGTRPTCGPSD